MDHFFFFNDTATTEIYTLSLHDALPISRVPVCSALVGRGAGGPPQGGGDPRARRAGRAGVDGERGGPRRRGARDGRDRKRTRLNSNHRYRSYVVFCLEKKKITMTNLSTE